MVGPDSVRRQPVNAALTAMQNSGRGDQQTLIFSEQRCSSRRKIAGCEGSLLAIDLLVGGIPVNSSVSEPVASAEARRVRLPWERYPVYLRESHGRWPAAL